MPIVEEIEALACRPEASLEALWARRPTDRAVGEQGLELAYAAASLPPPERIVWCSGPLDFVRRLHAAPPSEAPGASVKSDIFDRLLADTSVLAEAFWKELLCEATAAGARDRCVAATVDRAVSGAIDAELSGFRTRMRHLWRRLRGLPRVLPRANFKDVAVGPAEYAQLMPYRRMDGLAASQIETPRLRGLWMLAASSSFIVPHEHVCWIVEKPTRLHLDADCRLHCADGPALQYRDGWSVWAWKGTEVPAWAIEHPERITLAALDDVFDPVLRRCLIDIMTPERLIASGAAKRLSRDATGTLWGINWQYRGTTIDRWSAVDVVDDTPGPGGAGKHHIYPVPTDLRTAREAVAWLYGTLQGAGPHSRARDAQVATALPTGSARSRLPVAAKIALTSAGATGGTPGSPTPPSGSS